MLVQTIKQPWLRVACDVNLVRAAPVQRQIVARITHPVSRITSLETLNACSDFMAERVCRCNASDG